MDQRHQAGTGRPAVGSQGHVRIQHGEQPLEVAVARRGEEGIDDRPLAVKVGIGDRGALDATTAAARELPGGRRRPPDDRRDVVERDREDVVEDERDALGRGESVEDGQQREADRVAEDRLVLGVDAVPPGCTIGSATCVSSGASRRVRRERSRFRHTRPTTVVSQARMFSTSLVSVRLSRIQASWTASSASLSEPSIR